jgi:hypothetical protein
MTFKEKCDLIDEARRLYVTFEQEFKEFLAYGNSTNGAYNHFSIEDIKKHEKASKLQTELEHWKIKHGSIRDVSPIPLSNHSILLDLEKINDELS